MNPSPLQPQQSAGSMFFKTKRYIVTTKIARQKRLGSILFIHLLSSHYHFYPFLSTVELKYQFVSSTSLSSPKIPSYHLSDTCFVHPSQNKHIKTRGVFIFLQLHRYHNKLCQKLWLP